MSDSPDVEKGGTPAQVLTGLGERIRGLRVSRGIDPGELAERAELDASHLGEVEAGGSAPSLDVLTRIAGALDVPLAELFTDAKPGPAAEILRGDEVPAVEDSGMTAQVLTPRAVVPGLYACRYRLSPNSEAVRPVRHEGHDWLYVLSGELHIAFDQDSTTLHEGDSVSFSSNVAHRLSATGQGAAEFLTVGAALLDGGESAHPS